MARTRQAQQGAGLHQRLIPGAGDVEAQHRAELFLRQRLFRPDMGDGHHQDLGLRRHLETGLLGDPCRIPPQRLDVETALVEQIAPQRCHLVFAAHMRSCALELAPQGLIGLLKGDGHRFIGAQDGVVEGLRLDDETSGLLGVGIGCNEHRRIAGPDADGGVGGGIGRAHHGGATCRQDHIGLGRTHELIDQRQGGPVDHLDDGFWSPCLLGRPGQHVGGIDAAFARRRMRRDNDGVARHQRAQRLEVDGGDGVGRGDQREDDTGRAR